MTIEWTLEDGLVMGSQAAYDFDELLQQVGVVKLPDGTLWDPEIQAAVGTWKEVAE